MSPAFSDNDNRLDWRKIGYHARSAFAVLLSLSVLIGGGWFIYSKANDAYIAWRTADDYMGEGNGESVEVLIPSGPSPTQVGDLLTEAGVVKSTKTFRKVAIESGKWAQLKAGRYKLIKEIPAETALDMLMDSTNLQILWVLFPEGTTNQEQVKIMAKDTSLPEADIAAAQADVESLKLPAYAAGDPEGYLFPSRYQVAEPPSATAVLQTQVRQFQKVAESLGLEGRAAELSISPHNVVTVASIIAAEVAKPEDQPMVAAVIYNRINQGMKLEMDSTVHYAIGDFSTVTTTAEQRATESPYNTYLNTGLPPGAISNPGESALKAALYPADTDALFFVTVDLDTGETKFAATLEEHNANVAQFQQWCQANKGRC